MTVTHAPEATPDTDAPLTVEETAAAVLAERATLADWQDRLDAAHDELAAADDPNGSRLLAEPGSEVELAGQLGHIRERIGLIERAIAAQKSRVLVAEARYLAAQADAHEMVVGEATEALQRHEEKTRRLLAQLEAHEGEFIARDVVIRSQLDSGAALATGVSWRQPKSDRLRAALFEAMLHVAVLREMAAGRDPAELRRDPRWRTPGYYADNESPEFYPACVQGPDALVPARAHVQAVHRLRARIAELEELATKLPAEIAEWERRIAQARAAGEIDERGNVRGQPAILLQGRGLEEPIITPRGLARRCERLEAIDDEIAEARVTLAALVGEPDAA